MSEKGFRVVAESPLGIVRALRNTYAEICTEFGLFAPIRPTTRTFVPKNIITVYT